MYLREIALFADEALGERIGGGFVQRFHRDTICIVEMYHALLGTKVNTNDIAKVVLIVSDDITMHTAARRVEQLLNVVTLRWPFVFDRYIANDDAQKKALILDSLQSALEWLAARRHWNVTPFKRAHELCQRQGLRFTGVSKKSWVSPDRRFRVRIAFDFELAFVRLFAVLKRNRSSREIGRVYLGDGIPGDGCLHDFLKEGIWKSRTVFALKPTRFVHALQEAEFASVMQDRE